jgi:glutathione synthase
MPKGIKLLVLTEHGKHNDQNSVYQLSVALSKHINIFEVWVSSSSLEENTDFFSGHKEKLWITKVTPNFTFENSRSKTFWKEKITEINKFDFVFLRLPPPLNLKFVRSLSNLISPERIFNNPLSSMEYGSKKKLIDFKDYTTNIKLVNNSATLKPFVDRFVTILKPLNEHGGIGILKIKDGQVDDGQKMYPIEKLYSQLDNEETEFLAMKFLDPSKGDKRIVVVNGEIIFSLCRFPGKDSWLCNVAQGGTARIIEITKQESLMAQKISEKLLPHGIVFFGIDTLEENGHRYLSEINCTSIGGIGPAEKMYKKDFTIKIADLLVSYMQKKLINSSLLKP